MFSICLENFLPFSSNLNLSSSNASNLEESKICGLEMNLWVNENGHLLARELKLKTFSELFEFSKTFAIIVNLFADGTYGICLRMEKALWERRIGDGRVQRIFNPSPDDKILDLSKLKQIAEDISKCIWNEKSVPYRVENIVRKGEIACYNVFHSYISLVR